MTNNIFRNKSLEIALNNLGYHAGRPWAHFMRPEEVVGYMTKGWGSMVHGHSVEVSNPRYGWVVITEHKWSYDGSCCLGRDELDYDTTTTSTLRIADAIVYLATIKW